MRVLRDATEDEMIEAFVLAELGSTRHGGDHFLQVAGGDLTRYRGPSPLASVLRRVALFLFRGYGRNEYWVQPATDPEAFLALVDLIRTEGEPGQFARTRYSYLTISGWTYWVSRSAFPPYGLIVNRRRADHDQGDGSTFAQDWNEGLDDAEPHEQARLPL
jgi:hypothetical protein